MLLTRPLPSASIWGSCPALCFSSASLAERCLATDPASLTPADQPPLQTAATSLAFCGALTPPPSSNPPPWWSPCRAPSSPLSLRAQPWGPLCQPLLAVPSALQGSPSLPGEPLALGDSQALGAVCVGPCVPATSTSRASGSLTLGRTTRNGETRSGPRTQEMPGVPSI